MCVCVRVCVCVSVWNVCPGLCELCCVYVSVILFVCERETACVCPGVGLS